ncbi:MAG: hypothetical protein Q9162_006249 [Coniocarpon cinnabarinum]
MSLTDQSQIDNAVNFLGTVDFTTLLNREQSATNTEAFQAPPNELRKFQEQNVEVQTESHKDQASKKLDTLFKVSISSLKSMKDPAKTSVLYAEPMDDSGRLLPFCERLRQRFTEEGYLQVENRPLKLHATVLNTLYASREGRGSRNKKPLLIDSTELIEQCEEFVWAEDVVLEKVTICQMGAKRIEDELGNLLDEQYTEIAARPLLA